MKPTVKNLVDAAIVLRVFTCEEKNGTTRLFCGCPHPEDSGCNIKGDILLKGKHEIGRGSLIPCVVSATLMGEPTYNRAYDNEEVKVTFTAFKATGKVMQPQVFDPAGLF